ncbi:hypothetical protein NM208_g15116 [Fusarium decemcellulare]|uniref:Uncharacterized protein n=1 Tax=Fusarium decemcellulare TaxID=57161 RepID=A0ACC1REG1_9HYPO|nr:hypothetical protein NM208_g15116 [Fusarium decemcellulare]
MDPGERFWRFFGCEGVGFGEAWASATVSGWWLPRRSSSAQCLAHSAQGALSASAMLLDSSVTLSTEAKAFENLLKPGTQNVQIGWASVPPTARIRTPVETSLLQVSTTETRRSSKQLEVDPKVARTVPLIVEATGRPGMPLPWRPSVTTHNGHNTTLWVCIPVMQRPGTLSLAEVGTKPQMALGLQLD